MEKTTTYETACKVVPLALQAICSNGGSLPVKDVFASVEKTAVLNEFELGETKSGHVRWRSVLQFYSVYAVKAGFLLKKQGAWLITEEGEKALAKGGIALVDESRRIYAEKKKREVLTPESVDEEEHPDSFSFEDIESQADESIRNFIKDKNPYEFQELVAALLRAMGYYTPFIAPKGKDGGVDIIAYKDPLGTEQPTLKVQVKHYPTSTISVDVVRSLMGILSKDSEVGLLVTSGGFTSDAVREARHSYKRLRLIDINEFISLWVSYFGKMTEADQALLPITPVYFVKPQGD